MLLAAMPGRSCSWAGEVEVLVASLSPHIVSPDQVVYGENPSTAKIEPEKILKFSDMWVELQKLSPSMTFKKMDLALK